MASRKAELDVSRIFLTYAAYCGDIAMTARACSCRISDVHFLASTEDWGNKLREMQIEPITANSERDMDKAMQATRDRARMACYVQAIRLRGLIDQTLKQIYENPENIEKFCTERDKRGHPFYSTKPIKELIDAAEKAHHLVYRALGDVITEADKDTPDLTIGKIKELHMTVIHAMAQDPSVNPGRVSEVVKYADRVDTKKAAEAACIDVDAAMSDTT